MQMQCDTAFRYVWEGEHVRVTADITSSDLLRIEVKAHQVPHAFITNHVRGESFLCLNKTSHPDSASQPSISCGSFGHQLPLCVLPAAL